MEKYKYLDNLFEPIAVLSEDGAIKYYNGFFATFFKTSPRLLKKMSGLSDLFEFEGRDLEDFFKKVKKEKSAFLTEELRLNLKDGSASYVVVARFTPVDDEIIFCLNDFSIETRLQEKYKQQLKELKSSHQQLLQSDKLATIGKLSAGISHEINTPLTIAYGNAQNIDFFFDEEGDVPLDKIKRFNQRVCEALEKMSSIISNMKSFVHKPEDHAEYCNLNNIISDSVEIVSHGLATDNLKIEMLLPEDPHILLINKLEVEQVLVNIVQNAVDALEEINKKDGKITIKLFQDSVDKFLNIEITDNGGGIPEDIYEEVFTPFYTTKGVDKGTGLGLAISRNLVEKHNGNLEISNSSDKGTTFLISFPMIEDSSISHNQKVVDSLMDGTVKRILVVDDEPEILNLMEGYIQDSGNFFIGSANGEEALKLVGDFDVDIVVTDYFMPKLNGTELATKIRSENSDVPIFYLSSEKTLENYNKDKVSLNISGLILKPFTKADIIKMLGLEKD